eukprot:3361850-Amphidinium_carterae.1
MSRDIKQAMAEAKAKNEAKIAGVTNYRDEALRHAEGPRAVVTPDMSLKKPPEPFFASPSQSEDDEPTELTVMSPTVPV